MPSLHDLLAEQAGLPAEADHEAVVRRGQQRRSRRIMATTGLGVAASVLVILTVASAVDRDSGSPLDVVGAPTTTVPSSSVPESSSTSGLSTTSSSAQAPPPSNTPLQGTLPSGEVWQVDLDETRGLCVVIGEIDLGCEDVGPGVPAGSDPATPRTAAAAAGPFPEDEAGQLAFGFLPAGATNVSLRHSDGRTDEATVVVSAELRVWASPITPGDNPDVAVYLDADGRELATYSFYA